MKKGTSFFTDRRVRINNKSIADKIQEVYDAHNPQYPTYNSIMVEAMKHGLPYLLEEVAPQNSISRTVKNEGDRVIKHINRKYESIMLLLQKIFVSSILSQEMNTLIINEVEQILEANGIIITESIREQLVKNIPQPFETELKERIEQIAKGED